MKELPGRDETPSPNTLHASQECSPCRDRHNAASETRVVIRKIPAELLTHLMSLAGNGRAD